MQTIGERIKPLREQMNLTQKELAEQTKIAPSTMNRIENDSCEIKSENLISLMRFFKVSPL